MQESEDSDTTQPDKSYTPLPFEQLYEQLRQMAKNLPAWIEEVDANASTRPDMWGKRAFRIVLPHKQEIWIREA